MVGSVESHYASDGIVDRIIGALGHAGFDIGNLEPDALAGADEFHIGGRIGSQIVADTLTVGVGDQVLDVGCGIGGFARFLSGSTNAHVTGIDLTPEFIDAAIELSNLVGVSDQVNFQVGSATDLPLDDGLFDAVTMIHVGMNIADKHRMMAELARVARPGAMMIVYDVMRVGDGELTYPMPWASTEEFSFLAPRTDYEEAAQAADLVFLSGQDHGEMAHTFFNTHPSVPPPVNLGHLMGSEMPTMFGNARAAVSAGIMSPILVTFRAD